MELWKIIGKKETLGTGDKIVFVVLLGTLGLLIFTIVDLLIY
jgi:hypothetical protein